MGTKSLELLACIKMGVVDRTEILAELYGVHPGASAKLRKAANTSLRQLVYRLKKHGSHNIVSNKNRIYLGEDY